MKTQELKQKHTETHENTEKWNKMMKMMDTMKNR